MIHDEIKAEHPVIEGVRRLDVGSGDIGNDPLDLHDMHSRALLSVLKTRSSQAAKWLRHDGIARPAYGSRLMPN